LNGKKLVKPVTPERLRTAYLVAIGADCLQILLFPLFAEGFISPFDDALDLAVGFALVRLVGWRVEFLPSFAAKLVPGLDLVPTWTLALFLATRGLRAPAPVPAKVEVMPREEPPRQIQPPLLPR
jgi:hypothetical protein